MGKDKKKITSDRRTNEQNNRKMRRTSTRVFKKTEQTRVLVIELERKEGISYHEGGRRRRSKVGGA